MTRCCSRPRPPTDEADRIDLYKQIAQKLHDDYLYIFFAHTLWTNAFAENVHGVCDRVSPEDVPLRCVSNGRNWFSSIWIVRVRLSEEVPNTMRYWATRIAGAMVLLLVVSMLTFGAMNLLGDPLFNILGPTAGDVDNPESLAKIEAVKEEYNLDDPLPVRYVLWFGGVRAGRFRRAVQRGRAAARQRPDRRTASRGRCRCWSWPRPWRW